MITNTKIRDEQSSKRMFLRSASKTFENVITDGTNCSAFEAEIIKQKAQEIFRLGEYNFDNTMQPGQMRRSRGR